MSTASSSGVRATLLGQRFGKYRVDALLGRGATATVYRARDCSLERDVALKVLLGQRALDAGCVDHFLQEARAAAPLRNPHIVQVYEAGTNGKTPYIAMELVKGRTLEEVLQRRSRLPWPEALSIARQTADGLRCAHQAGIVHRDVKPANILVSKPCVARLTDFGIAIANGPPVHGALPWLGTPQYVAPEVYQGEQATPLTDLYGLGVVLYQMLTGALPFSAETAQALRHAVLYTPAASPRDLLEEIPDDVCRLVRHLLEKPPSARIQGASNLLASIDRIFRDGGGRSAMPEALEIFRRDPRAHADTPYTPASTPVVERDSSGDFRMPGATRLDFRIVALACSVAIVALAGVYRLVPARAVSLDRFPILDADTRVAATDTPVHEFVMPIADMDVRRLFWLEDDTLALCMAGSRGGRRDGSSGLAVLDIGNGELRSIVAPGSERATPNPGMVPPITQSVFRDASQGLAPGVLLAGSRPRWERDQGGGPSWSPVSLSARPIPNATSPIALPAAATQAFPASGGLPAAISEDGLFAVVGEMDTGKAVSLAVWNRTTHGWAHVATLPFRNPIDIAPDSLSMAREGKALAFAARTGAEVALFLATHQGTWTTPQAIAIGEHFEHFRFSPRATFLGTSVRREDAPLHAEVFLVSDGSRWANHDTVLSIGGWNPQETAFVARVREAETGAAFLATIDVRGRSALRHSPPTHTVECVSEASPSGAYAAAALASTRGIRIAVYPLAAAEAPTQQRVATRTIRALETAHVEPR